MMVEEAQAVAEEAQAGGAANKRAILKRSPLASTRPDRERKAPCLEKAGSLDADRKNSSCLTSTK